MEMVKIRHDYIHWAVHLKAVRTSCRLHSLWMPFGHVSKWDILQLFDSHCQKNVNDFEQKQNALIAEMSHHCADQRFLVFTLGRFSSSHEVSVRDQPSQSRWTMLLIRTLGARIHTSLVCEGRYTAECCRTV